MNWLAFLQDYTVQTVVTGAAILGMISGVLGTFAVLRKQSLLGDALSHAALPGICLGFLWAGSRSLISLLTGAFLVGSLGALAILLITRQSRLKPDAALGIVLSVFFAVGLVLLTYIQAQGGAGQAGLSSFLFGQAAAMQREDLWLMGGITLVTLSVIFALWKELKLISFDPGFALAIGMPVLALEVALTLMVALAIVVGLQTVGVVLMTAMLIAPAVAARQWVQRLEGMVLLSALFGVISGVTGATISAAAQGLATGPIVVLSATTIVLISISFAPQRGLVWASLNALSQRRSLRGRQVLLTLYGLSLAHDDPAYPSEKGMIDAYHNTKSLSTLRKLERQGLTRAVQHPPEPTPHWELTVEGLAAAETLAAELKGAE
jgi:manganese/zinc/iron transport system permease protein